jgi:hypothetical protein
MPATVYDNNMTLPRLHAAASEGARQAFRLAGLLRQLTLMHVRKPVKCGQQLRLW